MTTKEYADKYGLTMRTIYRALYSGRIVAKLGPAGWDIDDQPPSSSDRWRSSDEILSLPDYEMAIIWYTASISGDSIIIRNIDPYFGVTVSGALYGTMWSAQRNAKIPTWVYKATSQKLVDALRSLGFTGKKDPCRQPPPVDQMVSAQALMESHCSFGWALRYADRDSRDKDRAYYTPSVRIAGSAAIVQAYADALNGAGIIPPRKLSRASNYTTKILGITSSQQLTGIYNALAHSPQSHKKWWDKYYEHISSPPIWYYDYHDNKPPHPANGGRRDQQNV